jgi:hypothetical protein
LSACKFQEASQWVSWFGFSFWIKPISFILKIIQDPYSMVPHVNKSLATPRGFWVVLNIGGWDSSMLWWPVHPKVIPGLVPSVPWLVPRWPYGFIWKIGPKFDSLIVETVSLPHPHEMVEIVAYVIPYFQTHPYGERKVGK